MIHIQGIWGLWGERIEITYIIHASALNLAQKQEFFAPIPKLSPKPPLVYMTFTMGEVKRTHGLVQGA